MAHKVKRSAKSVDLPPRGHPNRDPITKAPGAHPVEVGIGSALGGAAAGLAAGALGGPVGAVIGTVVGGVAGGYGGKAVGEAIDPTSRARKGAVAKRAASRKKTGQGPAPGRGKTTGKARAGKSQAGKARARKATRARGARKTGRG